MFTAELLEKYGKKTAVITDEGQCFSYHDLASSSNKLFTNIGHRCLVFCLCKNSFESLTGYVSFLSHGIVPLLLDASMDISMIKELITIYEPEYIWLPASKISGLEKPDMVFSMESYSLVRLKKQYNYILNDDLTLLLTTSGSTGSPKLVRLSTENILSNARSIINYLNINEQERPVTSLPMYYSFGLSIINSHLLVGATLLLTSRSLMEKEFWALVKSEKATSLSGVPYTFEMLKKLRFFRMDLPFLKTLTQAGGKLNNDLNREFSEFCFQTGKQFFVMYGQTEATARMGFLPPQYAISKLGSMGRAIPGGEFSLIDDNGKKIEECDVTGELVYKGKNVSLGYAECREDLCKGDENMGILTTGDLAKRDIDGFYYIVGRKKRFIKIFGNRINLDETERMLKNIVPECACSGVDDQMIIYITDKSRKNEVLNYLSGRTGIHSQAFIVKQIDTIPKNASGKTIYSKLES